MPRVSRLTESSPRYIKVPDPSSQMWKNGETLDSGTMMTLVNNIHQASVESCKELFTCLQPEIKLISNQEGNFNGYGLIDDLPSNIIISDEPHTLITWGSNTAHRFGPFLSPDDLRRVQLTIGVFNGNQTDVLIYLTKTASAPSSTSIRTTVNQKITLVDVKEYELTVFLSPNDLGLNSSQQFSTDSLNSQFASTTIQKFTYYIWIGLNANNANTNFTYLSGMETL